MVGSSIEEIDEIQLRHELMKYVIHEYDYGVFVSIS